MDEDLEGVVQEMAEYAEANAPTTLRIPAGVGDAEAVHAVQKHYADAGFECDEDVAASIVEGAR